MIMPSSLVINVDDVIIVVVDCHLNFKLINFN